MEKRLRKLGGIIVRGQTIMDEKNFEQSYLHSEQWLEILDELNIGAFTVGFDRRVLSMNHSAQALMGLREGDAVGRDCREVFWGVPCLINCLIRGDEADDLAEPDVSFQDEYDEKFLVTRMATPVYDQDHQMIGCLTILQDHSPIADLINRIQYEERSMKMVLDNLDVGIFTVNRGGLITFFNKAAEKMSGYQKNQVLGEPCTAIFEENGADDICLLEDSIADGKTRSTANGKMFTIDGITVPVRANYMALRNEKSKIVGGLATFHDLTLVHRLNQAISDRYTFHDMIGKSPAMQKTFEMVAVVAKSNATILIEGATGTGKDLLAKVIHSAGRRSKKPFVKVNCAAIPENLLESELFGYVRGAFTGAERDKPGRFQLADGGTIFLDEIGDLPQSLQAKLLRVLEDKEFYPLGSRQTHKVDVRIVSATNRDLDKLLKKSQFRQDLYYRLNVVQIKLPPLKERREDLPLLISHIVRKLNADREKPPPGISEEVMDILLNFDYPGNVRELENILEHALIICAGDIIKPEHLPVVLKKQTVSPKDLVRFHSIPARDTDDAEREKVIRMLDQYNGHRMKTAKALGIDRTTLWRKMNKYGIAS